MFARIAPKLVDNGWPSPLPCKGKQPIPVGWNIGNVQPIDDALLEAWCQQYPDANVGHATGNGIAYIDQDILDPAIARDVDQVADDILGRTRAVRIGRAPKSLRVYRGTGIRSRKCHPLEIFGDTGQAIFYGIHPVTGQPYIWPDEEPLHLSPSDLPEITAEQVERFLIAAAEVIGRSDRRRTVGRVVDLDLFRRLRAERAGKLGSRWVAVVERQLREAQPGELHDTLLSVSAALVGVGYDDKQIRDIIEKHFAAPRTGPYRYVWEQVGDAIAGARRRWASRPVTPSSSRLRMVAS
jgi:hypothetical protein